MVIRLWKVYKFLGGGNLHPCSDMIDAWGHVHAVHSVNNWWKSYSSRKISWTKCSSRTFGFTVEKFHAESSYNRRWSLFAANFFLRIWGAIGAEKYAQSSIYDTQSFIQCLYYLSHYLQFRKSLNSFNIAHNLQFYIFVPFVLYIYDSSQNSKGQVCRQLHQENLCHLRYCRNTD